MKPGIFLACLVPLAGYLWGVWHDTLGANPIETVTRGLGTWSLNLLCITLAVTPLRRITGWAWLAPLRRMLGLFAFFYLCLHLLTYLWLDQFFDWSAVGKDILKRPFITSGMLAFLLLLPLALTSNAGAIRRLGGLRWRRLHRLIYPAALLAVLHYAWMVKLDLTGPIAYFAAVALLLGLRAVHAMRTAQAVSPTPRRVIRIVERH